MSIPISPEEQRRNDSSRKNACLIRVKTKLPAPIKTKLKRSGAIWLESYQGYAIPIEQKGSLENLLDPWKAHVHVSEVQIDPKFFTPEGRAQNGKDIKISILQEQLYRESMQLMCDIRAYDLNLSESDFDTKPTRENKTDAQIQTEATFYERRQALVGRKKELESLTDENIGMNHEPIRNVGRKRWVEISR